jgi:hypothetical protein
MSALRLIGLVVGVAAVTYALVHFRGPRWNRQNFYLLLVVGVAVSAVSLVPGIANILTDLFDVGDFQFGRLISLLLVTTAVALFLALYTKVKHDNLKHQVDRVFCAWAADELLPADAPSRIKSIMIILPALNEAKNLEKVLPRIPAVIGGREVGVLVVDDGSDDDTVAVALRYGAVVARNPINRGQGAAQRVGYRVLQRHQVELGVTMDSDNQHRPEDLPAMLQPVIDRQYDLVIGSRILGSHSGGSTVRVAGVHLLSRALTAVTGTKITDCSSGFKAFRMDQINKITLTEDQYQASEVLIRAAKEKLRIGEVPIHIAAREFGVSRKGHDFAYGLFYVKAMVKAWLS